MPLKKVVWWICTCQTDMQMCLGTMIFHQIWGCGRLILHPLWSYSAHLLAWGSVSLIVGLLCTGLISTLLSYTGSRHRYTVLLGLGIITKLLQHFSPILSTHSVASIWCSCVSSSFLNGPFSTYATYLGSAWYDFTSSLPAVEALNSCQYVTLFMLEVGEYSICDV